MNDQHRDAYIEEASELLAELEGALLELEKDPENLDLIGRVFRALHTIKGSGAMFGFDAVSSFTHELETAFDNVRNGRARVTPEVVGITLDARDHIQNLLRSPGGQNVDLAATSSAILSRLHGAIPPVIEAQPAGPVEPAPPPPKSSANELRTYRIRFDPEPDILLNGTNPILLLEELRGMGDFSLVAHLDRIPKLADFRPDECYTHWDAVLTTAADENEIRDVFIFVEDHARLDVQLIDNASASAERARLGEILADRGDVSPDAVDQCLRRPLAGQILVEAGLVTQDRVDAAVLEQQHLDAVREKSAKTEAASTLRVPAAKLDALVNVVGELVTVQARLSSYALCSNDTEISFISEEIERLTEHLRESTMSIRMLPIGDTFSRFKRLVRDLAGELGKEAVLVAEGTETELDKSVIEQLRDPLVHLVRNAVDHGIEDPGDRVEHGKPPAGTVRLSARHSGAFVLIEVSDDGAGMNRDAIRARAVERGIIALDAALSDAEVFALTLAPGFSTADKVTSVSGRGVGMDVVQRGMEALRGTLSIASTPGQGTVVTLKIPLTLAIIEGLLVETGDASFVIPLSSVSGCIEMEHRGESRARHSLVDVRGDLVPYISLRDRFSIPGMPPPIEQVIVAETRYGKHAFVVDRILGDHHAVIKKLGDIYRHVQEVSGATILGDGRVALILDVDKIAQQAQKLEPAA